MKLLNITKLFSCGCRNWTLTDKDETNKEPEPKDYLFHTCEKLRVYQKHGSINRLFIKK